MSLELPNKKQRSFDNTLTTKSSSTIQHETKSKSESLIAKQAALASLHIEERRNLKLNERNVWKQQQELSRSLQAQYEHHSLISEDKLAYLATLGNVEDRKEVTLNALQSNRSEKSAYERDGGLPEIPDNKLESIPSDLLYDIETGNEYKNVQIHGSPELQARLRALVEEYKTIFRSTLTSKPANLKPFKLEVDLEKWQSPANRLKARRTDSERASAMVDMISKLERANIIEPCNESYYSHGFLVPKKEKGKWRLVVDFKNLNAATIKHYGWPIPNIKELLHRIGAKRPSLFAVFDLTSGYYQIAIDQDSKSLTAFMTHNGVYRWVRLPMGLTGAGSHFQSCLTVEVLKDLLYKVIELYLDDGIVPAEDDDKFIENLRLVFQRFLEHNITLNPSKCVLGLSQVEYVGHTINRDGLHFTRDKVDSVLNFPRLTTKRQVKAFLGLANYFRDHVRNHSTRVIPLQNLVDGYTVRQAHQKVKWTDECEAAFEDIKKAIDECPLLWFMDDESPIFLQTDASDYGIGAYLYQTVLNPDKSSSEHPIGFISKSIHNSHNSWDTPMKEGFAIYYALRKWEHLLRDRRFTILTDHENLTRLRADHDTNKMVKRWFLCYQEFDIEKWGYVKGEKNIVPDTFSRLCPVDSIEPTNVIISMLTGYEVPTDAWENISAVHNTESGHGGVERTLRKLDEKNLNWDKRTLHVKRFIKMCACCQKMDQIKRVIHSYPFTTSSYGVLDLISIDIIEGLPEDIFGMNMIIVIIDNFSRFVDLHPTKTTAAEAAVEALLQFCGRYGTPHQIKTDQGNSFKNELFDSLVNSLGMEHFLTTAYSKEENGINERANKEVIRHLKNIVFEKRVANKWSKYLPLVQRIINGTVHSSTGLTPAQIMFPNPNNGWQLDRGMLTEQKSALLSAYMKELMESQAMIIDIATHNLRQKDEKYLSEYPKERTQFEIGSYVLAEHRLQGLKRGPKSKLLPFLRGPMRVIGWNNENIYHLQNLVTQTVSDYHVSKLRPFLYDERTKTPIQAALTDTLDEFVVEKVLDMQGDPHKMPRKNLQFKVRWAGYGPQDDTWEPWDFVKDNDQLQLFLYNHHNKHARKLCKKDYIPPQLRPDIESSEED